MPTSNPESRKWATETIKGLAPKHVLDIGPGEGTYGRMRGPNQDWEAVEIFEPYVARYNLTSIYDDVIIGDGLEFLERTYDKWDLIIMGDVVEHLVKEDGYRIMRLALQRADYVLVVMPHGEYKQGPMEGNAHEEHLATWETEEMLEFAGARLVDSWSGGTVTGFLMFDKSPAL